MLGGSGLTGLFPTGIEGWVNVDQLIALRWHRFEKREIIPKEHSID